MNIQSVSIKIFLIAFVSLCLFACSGEPGPKLEAQKKLEAEAKEIQAKAKARIEFKEKNCKDLGYVECQKLMREAGLIEGKALY